MRRLFRTLTRPVKRLARPLRLRWIEYCINHSRGEVLRLLELRDGLRQLELNEHVNLVKLDRRRNELLRWEP
jgi:hypothetical protein